MNGFLLINKPEGITSYDVIRKLKLFLPRKTKIGHSGTLDPFATGLLIIAIGRNYTRQLNTLLNLDKTYQAEITFGIKTDSYDIDGAITYTHPTPVSLIENDVLPILNKFKGTIQQTPPIFSAKKINGKPAYKHAREGTAIELKKASVTIYEIALNTLNKHQMNVSIHCSKGTYIRSLAHDFGEALSTGAHLSKLNRLAIGHVSLESAIDLDDITMETLPTYLIKELNT
jgi:tRNA pseudouridine55 synthase